MDFRNLGRGCGRNQARHVFPDKEPGQQEQAGEQTMQAILAQQRHDARILPYSQMGFIENHLVMLPDQPGQQPRLALFPERFIAQEVGI